MEDVVVTDTKRPERMGVKTERRGSVLCLTDWISGTASLVFATKPGAFFAASCFRRLEKPDSEASEGCTETTTSLARYAIAATALKLSVYLGKQNKWILRAIEPQVP
jgi:hypothetical protein